MTRQYQISQDEVLIAWNAVRSAGGGAGCDGVTIGDVEVDLEKQLYKIWNRLSSGSYMAQPVQLVQIPKVKGMRTLGIPTVTDRIAQTVIKNRLEPVIEPKFHPDSFAYRQNKSAVQAVGVTRQRCFQYKWVLEIDIKKFFDSIEHEKMLEMLKLYTEDPLINLYVKRFMKAAGVERDGTRVQRDKGTPQGGVISPLLANLFLHEAFDKWMSVFQNTPFERYADDIIVHCVSEDQAYQMRNRIEERLKLFGLEMNPEKTRIVYVGTDNRKDHNDRKVNRKFNFLGYDFKPRQWQGRVCFSPAIGLQAKKTLRRKMKQWNLRSKRSMKLVEIAELINRQVRGWINYYGKYRRSELYRVAFDIDSVLVKWIKKKHKLRVGTTRSWDLLKRVKKARPKLFCHWHLISSTPARAV